jgi:hypothetical protein
MKQPTGTATLFDDLPAVSDTAVPRSVVISAEPPALLTAGAASVLLEMLRQSRDRRSAVVQPAAA